MQAEAIQIEIARAAGVSELTWRTWRWIGLGGSHVVLVAPDAVAWRRLSVEAAVMERFRATAGPIVPRVLSSNDRTQVQIRERADGATGHAIERMVFGASMLPSSSVRYRPDCPLTEHGARFARDLGRTIAQFHQALGAREGQRLGVAVPAREADARQAEAVLRRSVDDGGFLLRAFLRAQDWLAALPADPVINHGDLHLYNTFVDETSGELRAIIDYDEIRIAHRADDLRYLHSCGLPYVRIALAAYAATCGTSVDEDIVGRYHAVAALDHFAFVAPDAPRFPEIIGWATAAVTALAPDWR